MTTGDPTAIRRLSDPHCGTCRQYASAVGDLAVKHQHIKGESIHVLSAEAPPASRGYVFVDVFFDVPARALVQNSGTTVEALAADPRAHKTLVLERAANGWLVRAVQAVQ